MSAYQSEPVPQPEKTPPPGSNQVSRMPGAHLRIDDAARREVSGALGKHLADGRLDMLEYEDRLDRTLAARTQGDLAGILDDLPPIGRDGQPVQAGRPGADKRRAAAKSMIVGWLTLALFFIGIWALSDFGGYFWPIWPIMGTGLGAIPGAYAVWNGTDDPDEDEDRGWF